jgi:hypothetical protein
MTRVSILFTMLLWVSACGMDPSVVMTGGSIISLIHTDKTLTDHEPYCQDPPAMTPAEQLAITSASLYCYRTLGGVSCYDRPDYTASNQTRVNYAYGYTPPVSEAPLAQIPAELPAELTAQ